MFSSSYSQALCLFYIKYPFLSHTQESTLATSQLFAEETLSGGLSPFTFWISILLYLFEISWDSLLHSLTIAFSWNATWSMNTNILFEAAVLVFVLPPGTKFRRLSMTVIELSGVHFGLKSYAWFQNQTSAQRELTLSFLCVWVLRKDFIDSWRQNSF